MRRSGARERKGTRSVIGSRLGLCLFHTESRDERMHSSSRAWESDVNQAHKQLWRGTVNSERPQAFLRQSDLSEARGTERPRLD